jgi:hypothetical protein
MQQLAAHVVALQDVRHRADYDRSKPVTRPEAENAIYRARVAVRNWTSVRNSSEAAFLLIAIIAWKNPAGR